MQASNYEILCKYEKHAFQISILRNEFDLVATVNNYRLEIIT